MYLILISAREEEITSHIIWWNEKKVKHLSQFLATRLKKVLCETERLSQELKRVCAQHEINEDTLRQWKQDVISTARGTILNTFIEMNMYILILDEILQLQLA